MKQTNARVVKSLSFCHYIDETADDRVTRVMLWCPPRSGSTAFLKCLTSVPNLQAWCAPFVFANFCALDGNFRNEFEGWLRQAWGVDTSEVISQISGKVILTVYLYII